MFSDYNVTRLKTIKGKTKQKKQEKTPKQLEIKQHTSK